MTSIHVDHTAEHLANNRAAWQLAAEVENICQDHGARFIKDTEFKDYPVTGFIDLSGSSRRLVTLYIKDLLLTFEHWQTINQQLTELDKHLLVCTDSLTEFDRLSNIDFVTHPALLGLKHLHVNRQGISQHQPQRLYNCFINRSESVRQTWLYFLYNAGLLDRGYVSYLLFQIGPLKAHGPDASELTDQELFDYIHTEFSLDQNAAFHSAYLALRDQVPYRNFQENSELRDKILDSKYSLVLDTFATADDRGVWFFSEKVARALMLPSIDLLFVQKGLVAKLQALGLICSTNELNLDQLDWPTRQWALVQALSKDQFEYNWSQQNEISQHNYNQFVSWHSTLDQFYDLLNDTLNSANPIDKAAQSV